MTQSFLQSYQAILWLTFIENVSFERGNRNWCGEVVKEAEFMNVQLR
jgi:hypothetical protein